MSKIQITPKETKNTLAAPAAYIDDEVEALEPYFERILKTGSRVICSPPPEDTDEDYMLLLKDDKAAVKLEEYLVNLDWKIGGSLASNDSYKSVDWILNNEHTVTDNGFSNEHLFHSWKKGHLNLLLTCNEQYFEDFTRATFLCKALNLVNKADRVTVFEALTRDVWPTNKKIKKLKSLRDYMAEASWDMMATQTSQSATEIMNQHIENQNAVMQDMAWQNVLNPPVAIDMNGWQEQGSND